MPPTDEVPIEAHDHKMLATFDRILWIDDGRIERIAGRDEVKIDIDVLEHSEDRQ